MFCEPFNTLKHFIRSFFVMREVREKSEKKNKIYLHFQWFDQEQFFFFLQLPITVIQRRIYILMVVFARR